MKMFLKVTSCKWLRSTCYCLSLVFMLSCGSRQESSTKELFQRAAPGKRVALVVGATYKTRPSWYPEPALPSVQKDITSIAQMLSAYGFTTVVVSEPTKTQLLRSIAATAAGLSGSDTLFFYFSGHGGLNQDHVSFADPVRPTMDFEHEFFVLPPSSSTVTKPSVYRVKFSEVLSELRSHLKEPLKRLIWIDDSCHSGASITGYQALVQNGPRGQILGHPWLSKQVLLIASVSYMEKALGVNGSHGGSLFTGAFLQAMQSYNAAVGGSIERMFQDIVNTSTAHGRHPVFAIAPYKIGSEPSRCFLTDCSGFPPGVDGLSAHDLFPRNVQRVRD